MVEKHTRKKPKQNNEIEKRKWGNDYKQDKWKSGEHMNTKQPQQQEWGGKGKKKKIIILEEESVCVCVREA